MTVACVILNYNDYNTTIKLLEKVVNYKAISYVIVVDNNSSNNSFSLLCRYKSEKVHVIKSQKNGGYGYGNNLGVRYAYDNLKAGYILIANPDVDFSNELVEKMTIILVDNKNVAAVSALPVTSNGNIQYNAAWNIPSPLKYLLITSSTVSKFTKSIYFNESDYKYATKLEVDCLAGSLLMVKADIMINYGMYDETIFLYCEETVLGFKFKNAGYRSIMLTDIEYTHYHSVSIDKSFKSKFKKRKILHESKIKVLRKYYNRNFIFILASKIFLILCSFETRLSDLFKR